MQKLYFVCIYGNKKKCCHEYVWYVDDSLTPGLPAALVCKLPNSQHQGILGQVRISS